MKVRMKIQILGTRDHVRWPAPGEVMDLPEYEARKLLASGFAEPVADKDTDVEKAVKPEASEKRARPRKATESKSDN